ncbi:hypothetical protein CTI12_AA423530 [Artemisia annua]|uniref:protein-serine/threonine phosphatase n=1 Tax=Artemisia annua TaxID=35608 RepID=A0A2U1LE51_ARTAN|nr:hypothetical protein CTI12_AA423530 [Artemisia annua]
MMIVSHVESAVTTTEKMMMMTMTEQQTESNDVMCSLQLNLHLEDVVQISDKSKSGANSSTILKSPLLGGSNLSPSIRSGSHTDIGARRLNEDKHIGIDDVSKQLGDIYKWGLPSSFYAIFDGHGGPEAASYVKDHVTRLFFEDSDLPQTQSEESLDELFLKELQECQSKVFLQADQALLDECSINDYCGTTALTVFILGRRGTTASTATSRGFPGAKPYEPSYRQLGNCFRTVLEVVAIMGDDPDRWIFAITKYFALLNTPADQRLRIVGSNLEGAVVEWFHWMSKNGLIIDWERFEESVRNQFGGGSARDQWSTSVLKTNGINTSVLAQKQPDPRFSATRHDPVKQPLLPPSTQPATNTNSNPLVNKNYTLHGDEIANEVESQITSFPNKPTKENGEGDAPLSSSGASKQMLKKKKQIRYWRKEKLNCSSLVKLICGTSMRTQLVALIYNHTWM